MELNLLQNVNHYNINNVHVHTMEHELIYIDKELNLTLIQSLSHAHKHQPDFDNSIFEAVCKFN